MARPENRSDGRSLSLTLPQFTFDFLAMLAASGTYGRTENEVAVYLLNKEADALYDRKIHERKIPVADLTRDGG